MEILSMFGIPVGFNESEGSLVMLEKDIRYEDASRKYSKGMFGLLADEGYMAEDEPYYDFYKAIGREGDLSRFYDRRLRFDGIVVMAGDAGGEFKKTAGHFHCEIPGSGYSYPELYQVVKGRAAFVMQKVDNPHKADGKMLVEDCVIAEVNAGEAIVVPPGYGHCTVNIGDGPMVFIDLVSCDCYNFYDSIKASRGTCCYIMKGPGGGFILEKNPRYEFACEPRISAPRESENLGLRKNVPAYTAYLDAPQIFDYLNKPDDYIEDMFAVFKK